MEEGRHGGATVLVIDDAEPIRRALIRELEGQGFTARAAEDGLLGLKEVERSRPDVILCDLRMPRMDGLEFLRAIHAIDQELPVIVMSGAGLLDDAIGALKLGAWDYIEKTSLRGAAVAHAIDRALERAALVTENRRYRARLEDANRELSATLRLLAEDEAAGREMQARMLPPNHQRFGPFVFTRELLPSTFLSGDFVDAFAIDQDRWGFYLADVSGHGVSSALVTVLLRTFVQRQVADFIRAGDPLVLSPAKLLERLNEEMVRADLDKHLTIFYCVLDNRSATLTYTNAGQFPWPLLADGTKVLQLAQPGMPIGLAGRARYREHVVELPERAVLAAFSDGLLEILPHADLSAKQAFLAALVARPEVTLEGIRRELHLDEARSFPDDIAMLLVKRVGVHG